MHRIGHLSSLFLVLASAPPSLAGGCGGACEDPPVVSGEASLTTYTSYAACCPDNPNYDPQADTTECTDYDACRYSGEFAVLGHQSYEWVRTHSLVAFFDDCDPRGRSFLANFGGRMIRLTKGAVTFDALIADTCGNADCSGCCSKNARPSGFLVDVEQWTVLEHLGSLEEASGTVRFEILDDYGTYPGCETNCGTVDPTL